MILPDDIKTYCDEKIRAFKDSNMWDAPKEEVIGVLSGYKLIWTNRDCGGFCNSSEKLIAINPMEKEIHQLHTMFHEMSHAFRYELEKYEKGQNLISEKLIDEIQTDKMAMYFLEKLFPIEFAKEDFNLYSWSEEDAKFLSSWYGEWVQNDLIF